MVAVGCAQDAGVASLLVVRTIQVDPPSGAVVLGQTLQLTATPKTEGGITVPAHDIAWTSTDNAIATVSSDGVVTGHEIGGPVRIRATMDGVTGETQIMVLPVPVHHVTVTPSTKTLLVGQQAQLTATAYDSTGAVLTGRTFIWSSDASSIAAITTTGLVLGMAPGGPVTIAANAEGKSGSAAVTVSGRPATRLGFGQQPGQAIAGGALTPAVQVLVQDDLLGTVGGSTNSVTIALAGNPGGSTLTGTTTVAAVNGIATFADLVLDRAGTGYTLIASTPGLALAISAPFTVVAGAANLLTLTVPPPATARSGIGFGTFPVVQIRDGTGNPVPQSGVIIIASIASGNGILGGTLAVATNALGAATFSNLSLSGPVGSFTISFSSPGVAPVTSGPITLAAGLPAALGIATQPSAAAQSGVVLARQPVIRLVDGSGNFVLQSGVVITTAIASGPAGGTLGGSATLSTDNNGVAAFAGLVLTGPAGSYVLGFGSSGLPTATSTPVVLAAAALPSLSLTTQPSAQVTNATVFPQQPVVQLRDAANNPVAQAGVIITASIQTGGGQLGGGTAVATDASGVAAFANLAITGLTGPRTLLFASAGYTSVVSGTVAVGPGAAAQLALTSQPSASAQSGVAFGQQPVIQLQDVSGNPVSLAGKSITASLASGPAGGSLGGTTVVTTDANGAAVYSNLSVTGSSGTYTLAFAATALSGATSNPVTLSAAAGTNLALATQPSSAAMNTVVFPQQPVVQLVDGLGSPVSQAGVPVSVAISSGSGTLVGVSTVNTDASGRAAFSGLSITGLAGTYTLGFTAPGSAPIASGAIALSAGPASRLTITTQPSGTAQSGVPFPQQPIVHLADVSGNPVSGAVVSAAISSGGGTLGGTSTATSDAGGNAAFTNLSITGTIGARTLDFSASGTPSAKSRNINLTAGPVAQILIIQQPSGTAPHGTAFHQQPIVQLLDAVGNPVAGTAVTAAIDTAILGSGALGGTVTINTDSKGLAKYGNLKISKTGIYTLKFTSGGVTSPPTSLITIT